MLFRSCRGQATVETALVLIAVIIPLTFALIAFAEIAWTYHALAALTRQGARYAGTHCWQDSGGGNVVNYMKEQAPAFPDRSKLVGDQIPIVVTYWQHDPDNQARTPFMCNSGSSCSGQCVPDSVTVSIGPYEFNHFLRLQVPSFSTTVEIESGGGNQETGFSLQN